MIRAIIFDLDGTLADTLADISAAANLALREARCPERSQDELRRMVGWGARRLMELAVPDERRQDSILIGELEARFEEAYGQDPYSRTKLFPEVLDTLTFLRDKGIPFGVNTNKPETVARAVLGGLLADFRPLPLVGARVGLPKKPDPSGARELASLLGVSEAECAYLGDSAVDIQTARTGGFRPLGAAWGFRGPEELS